MAGLGTKHGALAGWLSYHIQPLRQQQGSKEKEENVEKIPES